MVELCKTLLQPYPEKNHNSSWAVEPKSPASETVKEGCTPVHMTESNFVWQQPCSDLSTTAEYFDYDKKKLNYDEKSNLLSSAQEELSEKKSDWSLHWCEKLAKGEMLQPV